MGIPVLFNESSVRKIWLLSYLWTRQHEICYQGGLCEGRRVLAGGVSLTEYI
jgi:hypothetical protein